MRHVLRLGFVVALLLSVSAAQAQEEVAQPEKQTSIMYVGTVSYPMTFPGRVGLAPTISNGIGILVPIGSTGLDIYGEGGFVTGLTLFRPGVYAAVGPGMEFGRLLWITRIQYVGMPAYTDAPLSTKIGLSSGMFYPSGQQAGVGFSFGPAYDTVVRSWSASFGISLLIRLRP